MLQESNPCEVSIRFPASASFQPSATDRHVPEDVLAAIGTLMRFARDEEIFGEGESAKYIYKVVSGSVRTSKILDDGRRQIPGFYLAGDFFGFETGANYSISAEALAKTNVVAMKRSTVFDRAAKSASLFSEIWNLTAIELKRAQSHAVLLIMSAQERVENFLLEMADRELSKGQIELPMSRQDIADYLGLTIETVSRTLTLLEKSGVISLPSSRRIVLNNYDGLKILHA